MLASEFRRLRRMTGLTQEGAAHLLSVSHRTVLRWEHSESRIGPLKARAIRQMFAQYLFGAGEAKANIEPASES